MKMLNRILLSALVLAGTSSLAAAQTKVKVGMARLAGVGRHLCRHREGLLQRRRHRCRDRDVNSMPARTRWRCSPRASMQMIEGGISAGFFNALRQEPADHHRRRPHFSSPIGHKIVVRADLKDKIKTIKDLKGTITTTNGAGSISLYETGKVLGVRRSHDQGCRGEDPALPAARGRLRQQGHRSRA